MAIFSSQPPVGLKKFYVDKFYKGQGHRKHELVG